MKIAQIAPLVESCPPQFYGGTERIVSYLTEELVNQGHDVTLFATGDSRTRAQLAACVPFALRLNPQVKDYLPYHIVMLDQVRRRAGEFDILHFHIDMLQFPVVRDFAGRTLTTLHGRLDLPDLKPLYAAFPDIPLVSISRAQRSPLPDGLNWRGAVYHGLPSGLLNPTLSAGQGYLAFLGRISPEKRPDRAIEISARTGIPLRIAAKVDRVDQAYWEQQIQPMIAATPTVEYIGEIEEAQKAAFLGGARALLFPVDWPEPFGLAMIEAMACATPVIAFRAGAVEEIVEDGVTGFIVDTLAEATAAVGRLGSLDRARVRAAFDKRFTVERMAKDYVSIYHGLIQDGTGRGPAQGLHAVA